MTPSRRSLRLALALALGAAVATPGLALAIATGTVTPPVSSAVLGEHHYRLELVDDDTPRSPAGALTGTLDLVFTTAGDVHGYYLPDAGRSEIALSGSLTGRKVDLWTPDDPSAIDLTGVLPDAASANVIRGSGYLGEHAYRFRAVANDAAPPPSNAF